MSDNDFTIATYKYRKYFFKWVYNLQMFQHLHINTGGRILKVVLLAQETLPELQSRSNGVRKP